MKTRLPKLLAVLVTLGGLFIGSAIMAESFAVASAGSDRNLMFTLFWVGTFLASVPLIVWMVRRSSTPLQRVVSLIGLAGVLTLPKLLRSPLSPLFHDEYAHLRATNDILTTGVTNGFNSIVTPIPFFPGLHAVTAWVSSITHLDEWTSSLILISVAHIVALIGIYVLLSTLGVSYRGAAVGAAVYATNANYMFFHAQFGYESLGLPLVIWALVLATYGMRSPRPRRWWFIIAIAPISYAIASIHHLSAVGFLFILLIIAIYNTLHSLFIKKYKYALSSWAILALAGTFIYIRFIPTLDLLAEYLGSPATRGANQLSDIINQFFGQGGENTQSRTLFAGSELPMFERIASYGSTLIVGLLVATMIVLWFLKRINKAKSWSIPEGSPIRNAFLSFTILYLASVPFILTAGGAEGARRSWGYSFIGVALMFAIFIDMLASRSEALKDKTGDKAHLSFAWVTPAFTALWAVLLVGGVAAGVNETYRFPEPLTKVSDLSASSKEAVALGQWFKENVKTNSWALADRYSGLQVASVGNAQVAPASKSFPYWDLYWETTSPKPSLVAAMRAINIEYIVVDSRMETEVPENGFWFATGEPRDVNGVGKAPADKGALSKFDNLSIFTKVFSTEHYSVYKVNYSLYNPYETDREVEELYATR